MKNRKMSNILIVFSLMLVTVFITLFCTYVFTNRFNAPVKSKVTYVRDASTREGITYKQDKGKIIITVTPSIDGMSGVFVPISKLAKAYVYNHEVYLEYTLEGQDYTFNSEDNPIAGKFEFTGLEKGTYTVQARLMKSSRNFDPATTVISLWHEYSSEIIVK